MSLGLGLGDGDFGLAVVAPGFDTEVVEENDDAGEYDDAADDSAGYCAYRGCVSWLGIAA